VRETRMNAERPIEDRIKELIVRVLEIKVDPAEILDDEKLFHGGLGLNSIATLELVAAIEETFGIRVEDEELTVALFESVASLSNFVKAKLDIRDGAVQRKCVEGPAQEKAGSASHGPQLGVEERTHWPGVAEALETISPGHRRALNFLVIHTPVKDLRDIKADLIVEHVEYSYLARETLRWGSQINDQFFFRYVLPYRIWAEPIERWRKSLYDELYPLVRRINTPIEAAMEINRWAASKAHFEDIPVTYKGPLHTMADGYGDCIDLSVFFVAACRSVGIPARGVFSPWMPLGHDGTHMWTEVWDKGWHYLGSCEPEKQPDRAWFSMHIKKAAKVYALSFRKTKVRLGLRYCPDIWVEDVTGRYTTVGTLKVSVSEGLRPFPGFRLYFFVPNSKTRFVPVASAETNAEGFVKVKLGAEVEVYFVCPGDPLEKWGQFVHIDPHRTKEIHLRR